MEWLKDTLGFTLQEAARVVYANPGVLLSSVENSLMPKIEWLAEALQMDEEMVFDMIRRRVQDEKSFGSIFTHGLWVLLNVTRKVVSGVVA